MLNKLKEDKINAMKEKNVVKKNILSTLIGEIELKNKSGNGELQIQEIYKIIKKMIDNNILTNNIDENQYIEHYLPSLLSDNELEKIINDFISENKLDGLKSLGLIMKYLNENYSGQFDGKKASLISKNILL